MSNAQDVTIKKIFQEIQELQLSRAQIEELISLLEKIKPKMTAEEQISAAAKVELH